MNTTPRELATVVNSEAVTADSIAALIKAANDKA